MRGLNSRGAPKQGTTLGETLAIGPSSLFFPGCAVGVGLLMEVGTQHALGERRVCVRYL